MNPDSRLQPRMHSCILIPEERQREAKGTTEARNSDSDSRYYGRHACMRMSEGGSQQGKGCRGSLESTRDSLPDWRPASMTAAADIQTSGAGASIASANCSLRSSHACGVRLLLRMPSSPLLFSRTTSSLPLNHRIHRPVMFGAFLSTADSSLRQKPPSICSSFAFKK